MTNVPESVQPIATFSFSVINQFILQASTSKNKQILGGLFKLSRALRKYLSNITTSRIKVKCQYEIFVDLIRENRGILN